MSIGVFLCLEGLLTYLCTVHISQRSLFLSHVAQTSPAPLMLEIERAEGHYLFDTSGKRYLDFISGISVSGLGHGRTEIIEAVAQQAAKHMHTMVYGELIQQPQVQLSYELQSVLPESLNSVYFVNSGAEATEGAMKLAKRATGRQSFTALTNAYHGSTQGALSLMSDEYYTQAYRPLLPEIQFLEQNNIPDIPLKITKSTAAVIIELLQSEKGTVPCSREFVAAIKQRCSETGTLLIIDEIQTGMGRTGTFLASEAWAVTPDILLLGKAFGGGMPLASFIANQQLMSCLSDNPVLGHITTFGGHPVSCAAALAALKIIKSELEGFEVEKKENYLKQKFTENGLPEPEGKGLLLSLNLGTQKRCMAVIQSCLSESLFTDWFLFAPHKLRIAPPLSVTYDELDFAVDTIVDAVKSFDFGGGGV